MITHDMLHQQALFSKTLPTKMKDVLSSEVISVNVTKIYGLNRHLSCAFFFFFKEKVPSTPLLSLEKVAFFFFFSRLEITAFLKYVKTMLHFFHNQSK